MKVVSHANIWNKTTYAKRGTNAKALRQDFVHCFQGSAGHCGQGESTQGGCEEMKKEKSGARFMKNLREQSKCLELSSDGVGKPWNVLIRVVP